MMALCMTLKEINGEKLGKSTYNDQGNCLIRSIKIQI